MTALERLREEVVDICGEVLLSSKGKTVISEEYAEKQVALIDSLLKAVEDEAEKWK